MDSYLIDIIDTTGEPDILGSATLQRVFWFHYNKNNSKKAGKPQLTVHYKKQCLIVDNIVCNVATHGHIRKGEQPHFVIKGKCQHLKIVNNIAYIS